MSIEWVEKIDYRKLTRKWVWNETNQGYTKEGFMRNWKYKIELHDLHKARRANRMDIQEVALNLSKRINFTLSLLDVDDEKDELRVIGLDFLNFSNISGKSESLLEDYDSFLKELYAWGDNNNCWVK